MARLPRPTAALVAAVLVTAAIVLPGCRASAPRSEPQAALAGAARLADQHRYEDAISAYLRVARRAVAGPTFDAALAGAASSLISEIDTMPVAAQIKAITGFYRLTPAYLHPPALVTYTSGLLRSTAEEQVAWATLFRVDRERWVHDLNAYGSAEERTEKRGAVSGLDANLLSPEQVAAISAAMPSLKQSSKMRELYRTLATVAAVNRDYQRLSQRMNAGMRPTAALRDATMAVNRLAASSVAQADRQLREMR